MTETDMTETPAPNTEREDLHSWHPAARSFAFLGKASTKKNAMWVWLAGMIICIILGMMNPQKHPLPGEENIPGSWAIFGFIAYSAIVLSAPLLFRLLARDESYYSEGGLPDPDYSTDPAVTGEVHHD